jgi:hypothetical protein
MSWHQPNPKVQEAKVGRFSVLMDMTQVVPSSVLSKRIGQLRSNSRILSAFLVDAQRHWIPQQTCT